MRAVLRGSTGRFFVAFLALLMLITLFPACAPQPVAKEPDPPDDPEFPEEPKGDPPVYLPISLSLPQLRILKTASMRTQRSSVGQWRCLSQGRSSQVGSYTSPVYGTDPFEYMILSWNADTPKGTYIEIEGRVYAGPGDNRQWSNWLSWGCWSTSEFTDETGKVRLAGSASGSKAGDAIASVDTDELYVKGNSGETADRFQYRVTLHAFEGTAPKVALVASTIRNTLAGQAVARVYPDDAPDLSTLTRTLTC